jgi:alpha,alpha-trehalose phosphorylase
MWQYQNNDLTVDALLVNESLFTLANGYLGVRGCFEEGYGEDVQTIRGTYINGVYDIIDVRHPEKLHGFVERQDKQPNLIDLQSISIELDGELVNIHSGSYEDYERVLDLKAGYAYRKFKYTSKSGKRASICFKRLVSFKFREVFAQSVDIEYDGAIRVFSIMNTNVKNFTDASDPRVGSEAHALIHIDDVKGSAGTHFASYHTVNSGVKLASLSTHAVSSAHAKIERAQSHSSGGLTEIYVAYGTCRLEKFNIYSDSLRVDMPEKRVYDVAKKIEGFDFEKLLEAQEEYTKAFWNASDIQIQGNDKDQLSIRFNLYQLFQSVGRDSFSNISAKGLSGEGYEGHYFWDTEIYVLPTFQMTQREIAKQLLLYRYKHIESARDRARELGHKRGVKFPWRTISGIECSAYYPAGTAQYHINGDIAHAFIQYYLYTEDKAFMLECGAEVLLETALLWLDMGHFDKGKFKIDAVTGPDEYTAIVNNNYYTNALAKHNLEWAVKMHQILTDYDAQKTQALIEKLGVCEADFEKMHLAAQQMFMPYDSNLGIDMQDDGFLNKAKWDFKNTPESDYPLLLHYHPLTIYRYQVLKQPDTVLAHFLLEDYTDFETMKRSFDYYEAITTHDSSLSPCIYGIMASRLGYKEKAYAYFGDSLKLDLENTHGNTKDGLHMANMAGTALSLIYGFAGLRVSERGIVLRPWLPEAWTSLAFKIEYRGRIISVAISESIILELKGGQPIELEVNGQAYKLEDKVLLPL